MHINDLLVSIEILDDDTRVVATKTATTYKHLLRAAHDAGLSGITTELVSQHDGTIIVRATVILAKGTFTGIGDASVDNVPQRLRNALPRIAEVRSIVRAFKVGLCVPHVSVEELSETIRFLRDGQEHDGDRDARRDNHRGERNAESRPAQRAAARPDPGAHRIPGDRGGLPERHRGRDDRPTEAAPDDRVAMSEQQRKLLFRLVYASGAQGDAARERVLEVLRVERFEHATRAAASRAIDELRRHSNGDGRNGAAHGSA
jgi:hypothetical protein